MQLYGSTTSPYVRRLKIWLSNDSYEFIELDIMSKEGHQILKQKNPTLKVPVLFDGEQAIYDSRVIYRYLNSKFARENLTWNDENNLTLIDAANDSFVELLLLDRSGISSDSDVMFIKRQNARVKGLLSLLNDKIAAGEFNQWQYPTICLFCLLDWINFRELFDISELTAIKDFLAANQDKNGVKDSDPRL